MTHHIQHTPDIDAIGEAFSHMPLLSPITRETVQEFGDRALPVYATQSVTRTILNGHEDITIYQRTPDHLEALEWRGIQTIDALKMKAKDDTIFLDAIASWNPVTIGYISQRWGFEGVEQWRLERQSIFSRDIAGVDLVCMVAHDIGLKLTREMFFECADSLLAIKDDIFLFLAGARQKYTLSQEYIRDGVCFRELRHILNSLRELQIDPTFENVERYRSEFCKPFQKQRAVNHDNRTYQEWIPPTDRAGFQEYVASLDPKDYSLLSHDIAYILGRYSGSHEYRERVDPRKIVGSISGKGRGESWITPMKLQGQMDRDSYIYAQDMIDNTHGILQSFESDPVSLTKVTGPDDNCIYIITVNGNHRSAAAKLIQLPYLDAKVKNMQLMIFSDQKENTLFIVDEEMRRDYEDYTRAGIIDGEIKDQYLYFRSCLFPEAILRKSQLREYIAFYEGIYPSGFQNFYTPLRTAGVL